MFILANLPPRSTELGSDLAGQGASVGEEVAEG